MEIIKSVNDSLGIVISWVAIVIKEIGSWFSPSERSIIALAIAVISSLTVITKRRS